MTTNGFFTRKETESISRPDGKKYTCVSCGLYQYANSPKMQPFGNFAKGIMNIGEAPGEVEDDRGKPWQGKTGRLLQRTYANLGIDLFEDCININAIRCHPKDDRTPNNHEIDCCRRLVMKSINEYQPKVIVLLGGSALRSVIGHRWKKDLKGITKWRGFTIPDQDLKAWVCPTYHPSYVSREDDGGAEIVWEKDLRQAIEKVDDPFPRYKKPHIEYLEDLDTLYGINSKLVSFDYETTGLKPHAVGHRIVCASVAVNEDHVYTFEMPKNRNARNPFTALLGNPTIGKMAHNIKFEEAWSVVRLQRSVVNWEWDSMLAAHILDNRPGVTGLKFQVYVNFGVIDYSSEIDPFLRGVESKNGNSMNRIYEADMDSLLTYCAMDSIFQYRLAMRQIDIMNYDFLPF